jgi:hypothetical protein
MAGQTTPRGFDWDLLFNTKVHSNNLVLLIEHGYCHELGLTKQSELVDKLELISKLISELWPLANKRVERKHCLCPCHMGFGTVTGHTCCDEPEHIKEVNGG